LQPDAWVVDPNIWLRAIRTYGALLPFYPRPARTCLTNLIINCTLCP